MGSGCSRTFNTVHDYKNIGVMRSASLLVFGGSIPRELKAAYEAGTGLAVLDGEASYVVALCCNGSRLDFTPDVGGVDCVDRSRSTAIRHSSWCGADASRPRDAAGIARGRGSRAAPAVSET